MSETQKFGELVQDAQRDDGYVNATKWCKIFGYRLNNWKQLPETKARLQVLSEKNSLEVSQLICTIGQGRGSTTWIHPIMAVHLASYLDPNFANYVAETFVRYVTADPHLAADIASRQETIEGLEIINEAVQERYSFLEGKDWDWEGKEIDYGDEYAILFKEYSAERFARLQKKFGLAHEERKGIHCQWYLLNQSLIEEFLKDKYPSIYSGVFCTHIANYEEWEDDMFGLVGYFKEEIESWVKEKNSSI
ncbi:KilA-N domain-containing protein [Cronbergia sp. UHCC 0137]|uniref:KilA-N domain-containing protein n=1 Tax=Cronbergia sp. UHCC 0137 TaxID=3110239 RepID=UPI002B1FF8D3|nr:KilA-N domain-containing protein [Cronbergia sp. UHCC 0137]MEA5620885.1 KilA-N domain-containing protein [Cronbergia sp. UHCC 0137]